MAVHGPFVPIDIVPQSESANRRIPVRTKPPHVAHDPGRALRYAWPRWGRIGEWTISCRSQTPTTGRGPWSLGRIPDRAAYGDHRGSTRSSNSTGGASMSLEPRGAGLPRISVVVAVRNGARTLERALESVFEQTYEHVELIVMDGASTDGTQAILERNAARIGYWESKPDRGIYQAWNKALDHATGEWICFLGADDRFHAPDVLSRMAPVLADATERYRVVYARLQVVTGDGTIVRTIGEPWDPAAFRDQMTPPHPATFHHRVLFERNGRFEERYRIAGDYEFLLRELLDHDPLFVAELIVDMGAGGLSDRPSSTYTLLRERYRARYKHHIETVPAWRSGPLIRALCRIWVTRNIGRGTADRVGDVYRFIARRPSRPR